MNNRVILGSLLCVLVVLPLVSANINVVNGWASQRESGTNAIGDFSRQNTSFHLQYNLQVNKPVNCRVTGVTLNGNSIITTYVNVPTRQSQLVTFNLDGGPGRYRVSMSCEDSCGKDGVMGGTEPSTGRCGGDETNLPGLPNSCHIDCGCPSGQVWGMQANGQFACGSPCTTQTSPQGGITRGCTATPGPGGAGWDWRYASSVCAHTDPAAPAQRCVICDTGLYLDPNTGLCDDIVIGDNVCRMYTETTKSTGSYRAESIATADCNSACPNGQTRGFLNCRPFDYGNTFQCGAVRFECMYNGCLALNGVDYTADPYSYCSVMV